MVASPLESFSNYVTLEKERGLTQCDSVTRTGRVNWPICVCTYW